MRALPEGEALFAAVRRRISPQTKLAFGSTFLTGLLTHAYMLVNKLPNHDDILGLFIKNDSTAYGRWFLSVPSALSSSLSLPWVTGLLALLWLSLAAVCTVSLLQIKKPAMVVLTGMVMATFPTVFYTLCYLFTADAYLFALLLAALGVLFTDRYRFGFLLGGVCIGLSMATYQAYVFYAIGLIALRLMLLLLFEPGTTAGDALKKLAQYAAALVIGAVVYRVGMSVALACKGMQLKTYMGLDGMQSLSVSSILSRLPLAYKGYFSLLTGKSELLPGWMNAFLLAFNHLAGLALFVAALLRVKGPRRMMKIALSTAILCALPLALNGIVLVSTAGFHPLMQYPVCLAYVLPIVLYDRLAAAQRAELEAGRAPTPADTRRNALRIPLGYALSLCLVAGSFLWALDANQTYLVLELKFDNMMSLVTRMVDRVEQLPEYVPNVTPVWYTGTLSDANYGAIKSDAFARASATDMTGREWNYTTIMNNLYFLAFVNNYIGVTFVDPPDAEAYAAMETDEYKAMPYFPSPGSVKSINGIIIVNGGPNPQSPP